MDVGQSRLGFRRLGRTTWVMMMMVLCHGSRAGLSTCWCLAPCHGERRRLPNSQRWKRI